jgi:ubiquinone/menaquinone biosynthesis C-methylase UbiE
MSHEQNPQDVKEFVRERYAGIAVKNDAAPGSGGCCGPTTKDVNDALAGKLGYEGEDLSALPEGANLGLSCGNPTAHAALEPGDVVLDLGSGAGFDCFIAGRKVAAEGRVIGVDMTPEMIAKARRGLPRYQELTGLNNIEFRLGEIEHLPVGDNSVDVVISNCVLNLSAEKPRVWAEIGRVLKPGGRVAISDVALLKPIPDEVKGHLGALSSCFAGAAPVEEYRRQVEAAGLGEIAIEPKLELSDLWENYNDPVVEEIRKYFPEGAKLTEYAASVNVTALKPGGPVSASIPVEEPAVAAAGMKSSGGCCS